ncbi:IPT/TIG domain protein [Neobacillus sp. YX16]|uniref:PKD domain-containing protein n=1 Tax=Neobacillus sp. YX16 TaxID=3047874 RepID=UPI0024C2AE5F|nr:IPT/TIG domain protein [Neobacillus sp. YX16]WHZ05435.1 IPT/TIG domain protein [Neobacillus sp. YX16]
MLPRGLTRKVRKKSPIRKFLLVLLTTLIVISSAEFGMNGANAELVIPNKDIHKLQKVGPIHEDFGYPVWYKDYNGLRLELCADVDDPYCALDPAEIPDPTKPISFINDNFPAELFYQLAGSEIDLPNGGRAIATFALEAAWANEEPLDGDQIVFGRVRFRIDGIATGSEYTIYHPYGIDKFTAVEEDEDEPDVGEIRFVEDIGVNGGFEGAMKSRIGTFLEWDDKGTKAPVGYVGDPNQDHTIKNGYVNEKGEEQNYFRIVGDEHSGLTDGLDENSSNYCGKNCIQTDLFSLMGKKATNAGVDVTRATYSLTENGGTIDVFSSTEETEQQDIEVSATGMDPVNLFGSNGQYFARISFEGNTPPKLTVTNKTDNPDSVKTITPDDKITSTAEYDIKGEDKILTIFAESSDKVNPIKFSVLGLSGDFNENGYLIIKNPTYIPPNITVKSTRIRDEDGPYGLELGRVTIPVDVKVGTFESESIVPNVLMNQNVVAGEEVTLDASQSTGPIGSYKWTKASGPDVVLTDGETAVAKFKAPDPGEGKTSEAIKFNLTITSKKGTSFTINDVTVTVNKPAGDAISAEAGEDRLDVAQGSTITLDGSGSSQGEGIKYSWKQISGSTVPITNANTAKPTIVVPKVYSAENNNAIGTWEFELTVTGPGGTDTDRVKIITIKDALTVTNAELRGSQWRVSGTSTVAGPGVKITIYLESSSGPIEIGSTSVAPGNAAGGAWTFRGTARLPGTIVRAGTLKIVSTSGGELTKVEVRRFR